MGTHLSSIFDAFAAGVLVLAVGYGSKQWWAQRKQSLAARQSRRVDAPARTRANSSDRTPPASPKLDTRPTNVPAPPRKNLAAADLDDSIAIEDVVSESALYYFYNPDRHVNKILGLDGEDAKKKRWRR